MTNLIVVVDVRNDPILGVVEDIRMNGGGLLRGEDERDPKLRALFGKSWPDVRQFCLLANQVMRLLNIDRDVGGRLSLEKDRLRSLENGRCNLLRDSVTDLERAYRKVDNYDFSVRQ